MAKAATHVNARYTISLAIVFSVFSACSSTSLAAPPDLLLTNGHLFTADPTKPWAEALAISGNRIVAVGTSSELSALAGPATTRIDLDGHLVVPGFNDAHFHHTPNPSGQTLALPFPEPTWNEVLAALPLAAKNAAAGSWIYGTIGSLVVNDPQASRADLDRLAPGHPVLLESWFGHGEVFSTQAMRRLNIAEDEPDPLGGRWVREPNSRRITGKSFEYAKWKPLRRLADSCSDAEIIASLHALADQAAQFGITSIQNMTLVSLDRYVKLLADASFAIRMRVIRFPSTSVGGRDTDAGSTLPAHPANAPLVTLSGTKWILDGTPLERGMAIRSEYKDRPAWSGALNFPQAEVRAMLADAAADTDQWLFHAGGDQTVAELLNAIAQTDPGTTPWSARRVRIEHGDGLLADLVPLAKKLGVVVVQNPTHFDLAMTHLQDRFGSETKYQPLRSLLDAGIPIALGSDGPMSPGLNLMFAVIHPTQPSEALTLDQALTAYTSGSAYAEFAEREKGSLSPGKLADLAVLSQDLFNIPPSQFPATRSVMTLVDGKIVYDAAVLKRFPPGLPNAKDTNSAAN